MESAFSVGSTSCYSVRTSVDFQWERIQQKILDASHSIQVSEWVNKWVCIVWMWVWIWGQDVKRASTKTAGSLFYFSIFSKITDCSITTEKRCANTSFHRSDVTSTTFSLLELQSFPFFTCEFTVTPTSKYFFLFLIADWADGMHFALSNLILKILTFGVAL